MGPRYFQQEGDHIVYFSKKGDKKPKGIIPLRSASLREAPYTETNKEYCFEIIPYKSKEKILVCAPKKEDYHTWLSCIRKQIDPNLTHMKKQAYGRKGQNNTGPTSNTN